MMKILKKIFNFFGLFPSKDKAIKKGNERIRIGIKDYDVKMSNYIKDKENPFYETDSVEMCRENLEERVVYTINIKEIELEGMK